MVVNAVKMMGGHGMDIAAWTLLKDGRYDPNRPQDISNHDHFAGTQELVDRHPGLAVAVVAYMLFLELFYFLALRTFFARKRFAWLEDLRLLLAVSPIVYHVALNVALTHCYYRQRVPIMPFVLMLVGRGMFSRESKWR